MLFISPRAEICEICELSRPFSPDEHPRQEVVGTTLCRCRRDLASTSVPTHSFKFLGKSRICQETGLRLWVQFPNKSALKAP